LETKFRVGPAGYPTIQINKIKEMIEICHFNNFTALELEFVRITASEYPTTDVMKELAVTAHERNLNLSIHGSLYINLATLEDYKVTLAKEHITEGLRVAKAASANLIFHAGYFQDLSHEVAIRKSIDLLNSLQIPDPSRIYLETPGKLNSIGDTSELLEIASQTGVRIGIDWGHYFARSQGGIKEINDVLKVLNAIEDAINQKYFHMHISGIEYTKKGEKRHLPFAESEVPIEMIIQALQESGIKGTVICESPKRWEGDTELVLKLLQGEKVVIARKKKPTLLDFFK
jgi:deoxyribonuclease-4